MTILRSVPSEVAELRNRASGDSNSILHPVTIVSFPV